MLLPDVVRLFYRHPGLLCLDLDTEPGDWINILTLGTCIVRDTDVYKRQALKYFILYKQLKNLIIVILYIDYKFYQT